MLKLISCALLAFSVGAFAGESESDRDGVWAEGGVTYKHPNGALVNRDCELFVPSRGQGDVELKCANFSIKSSKFDTKKKHGRTVFSVIFKDVPGAPAGAVALYTGSYLRGSNKAIYYGDVYGGSATTEGLTTDVNSGWSHVGGFMFQADAQ